MDAFFLARELGSFRQAQDTQLYKIYSTNPRPLLNFTKSTLSPAIKAFFFAVLHFLSCFSRFIASALEGMISV